MKCPKCGSNRFFHYTDEYVNFTFCTTCLHIINLYFYCRNCRWISITEVKIENNEFIVCTRCNSLIMHIDSLRNHLFEIIRKYEIEYINVPIDTAIKLSLKKLSEDTVRKIINKQLDEIVKILN